MSILSLKIFERDISPGFVGRMWLMLSLMIQQLLKIKHKHWLRFQFRQRNSLVADSAAAKWLQTVPRQNKSIDFSYFTTAVVKPCGPNPDNVPSFCTIRDRFNPFLSVFEEQRAPHTRMNHVIC